MILSVIVPTQPGREEALSRCLFYLGQYALCETVVIGGAGKMGDKICEGLEQARGEWAVVVDDDDTVPADYLHKIVQWLKMEPTTDAVGYRMLITVDHKFAAVVDMRHGGKPPPWDTPGGIVNGDEWCLLPKCVFRTDHGRRLGFGNHYTADQDFSLGLAELVETSVFIPAVMYHYDKRSRHQFGGPVAGYGKWPTP